MLKKNNVNREISNSAKVLNIGSLNIDHVYNVNSLVQPGETISSLEYAKFAGGKGANQSVALSKAGAKISHAGRIGEDGLFLKSKLESFGVNTELIETIDTPTGHAIIQVDKNGENSIILHGGANLKLDEEFIDTALESFSNEDILLIQNEVNMLPVILEKASKKGMFIVFNPAPMTPDVKSYPLHTVDMLIINETEGAVLTNLNNPTEIVSSLSKTYPEMSIVLTLGAEGVIFQHGGMNISVEACKVDVVDTTAAGDTFIGYLIASMILNKNDIENALRTATSAAAITVQRKGAIDSIPYIDPARKGFRRNENIFKHRL